MINSNRKRKYMFDFTEHPYKGRVVFYYHEGPLKGMYSVQYCSDEVLFETLKEAQQFIDQINQEKMA